MFESCTKREPIGLRKMAGIAVIAAVALAAQIALLIGLVGAPLADWIDQMRRSPQPAMERPVLDEDVAVRPPYRPKVRARPSPPRDPPWAAPDCPSPAAPAAMVHR